MDITSMKMGNNPEKISWTDLHTHILPGMDDGAACLQSSLAMLQALKTKGIERVALTPHFYPLREELPAFLDRRAEAYNLLLSAWDAQTMPQIRLGAEVRYTPKIVELDLRQLTVGQGKYLLLELPDMGVAPLLDVVVKSILDQGVAPVFAHIERCTLFRNEPELLFKLVQMGALSQISAKAMTGKKDGFAKVCLKNDLAHVISSDAHSVENCAVWTFEKKDMSILERSECFARAVWDSTAMPAFVAKPAKKGLFGYRQK